MHRCRQFIEMSLLHFAYVFDLLRGETQLLVRISVRHFHCEILFFSRFDLAAFPLCV